VGTRTVDAQGMATDGPAGDPAGHGAATAGAAAASPPVRLAELPDTFDRAGFAPYSLAEVLAVLDLAGDVSPPVPVRSLRSPHGGVLGSQQLAQQVVLAERLAPGMSTRTLHSLFPNPSERDEPLDVDVEWLQSGRRFANLALSFRQRGRAIGRSDVLLGADAPDFVRHETSPPEPMGDPESGEPLDCPLMPWDVRVAPGPRPHSVDVWQRIPGVPADPALARGLIAFASDPWAGHHVILSHIQAGTAVLAPGERMLAAVLAQTVTFLEELDVREWHLLRVDAPYAGGGRFLGRGHVYTAAGRLCAVFETVGMLRAASDGSPAGVGGAGVGAHGGPGRGRE